MHRRTDQEAFENTHLASFACRSAATRGRAHDEPEHPYRGAYQRDRDRIVHSTAFRRLEYKTQVFVNHEGDHYRTRLTHTLEVAQIARTIARALRLNEDLVEAIALAHDLGHGPFGHAGEEEIALLMADHGRFDHNRQGLRVVDVLERRYPRWPGLNLTYEVREAFCKNFPSEGARGIEPAANVSLEAQLVSLADSIAYDNHDLDDGIESGLMDSGAIAREVPLWAEALEAAGSGAGDLDGKTRRRVAIRRLIGWMVTDIIEQSERAIAAAKIDSPDAARAHPESLVRPSSAMQARKERLEAYLNAHLYCHDRVTRIMRESRRCVRRLFEEYVARPESLLTDSWLDLAAEEERRSGLDRDAAVRRVICDYIAGMTDRYATDTHRRLFEPSGE